MSARARWSIGILLLALLFVSGVASLRAGVYGFYVFVTHPYALGALVCWVLHPTGRGTAGWYGFWAVLIASVALMLIRVEGAICILLSLPLTLQVGIAGARRTHRIMASPAIVRDGVAMLVLMPATLAYDTHAKPPVYAVTTSVEIAAPPEQVWKQMINLSRLPEPHEWYFQTGLAYPTHARIDGTGAGATRYCEFSTGPIVEAIDVWDAPRRLHFRVTENPAPMREWSPYGEIDTKHLHGYLNAREGEFRLKPVAGNRTLLEGTSWYQHGLWPAQYWRLWSDAIIHRIQLRVFHQIQVLAEAEARK